MDFEIKRDNEKKRTKGERDCEIKRQIVRKETERERVRDRMREKKNPLATALVKI